MVKPWTKLDTRRLTAEQLATQPDELAHVLAPAYLADGVATSPRVSGRDGDGTTRFTGRSTRPASPGGFRRVDSFDRGP